jgi:glycosyltransferase involved in cell wall biosynthesis
VKKVFFGIGLIVIGVAFFSIYAKDELNIAKRVGGEIKELDFVVVVPSFNNDAYFERNLNSIISQDYKKYQVIYIDDCSTDNTGANVSEYIAQKNVGDRFKLIHNQENRKALYNLYKAIHECPNDKIIVLLDGDDWFPDEHVLSTLNEYYQNPDMWMSYGQYIRYPDDQMGMCGPVKHSFLKKGKMRYKNWQYSHLRTFYAGLFKRIKLADLTENGAFFNVAWDHAIMFPMLEMAREHAYFTPDVLYVYNYETPLTDAKLRLKEQERVVDVVKKLPVYSALQEDPRAPFEEGISDLVVFSYNRPMQLYAFLESMKQNITGFRKTGIIYRADPDFAAGYDLIKKTFPEVYFFRQSNETPKQDFKPLVLETTYGKFGEGADYIAYAVDDIIITDKIDVAHAALKLKETGAYGVFYRLGKHVDYCYMMDQYQGIPDLLEVGGGCLAWQFKTAKGDWNYPNSVDLVLYAKKDIRDELEKIKYTFPNDFEGEWSKFPDRNKFGLCYERAKMVNIPMNIVSTFQNKAAHTFSASDLNDLFEGGMKIDINPFYQILNESAHADIQPQFVSRTQ